MKSYSTIKGLLIVQPNGTVLCQYVKKQHKKQSPRSSPNHSDSQVQKVKDDKIVYKKQMRQKLQKIKVQVIQTSRKLLRQAYQTKINRTIVQNNLVYYKAKYNVLFIVVTEQYSIPFSQVKKFIDDVLYWFQQKCQSMSIDTNLINRKMSFYQLGQFNKIGLQIDNYMHQQARKYQKISLQTNQPIKSRQSFVQQRIKKVQTDLNQRDQVLSKIRDTSLRLKKQKSFKNKSIQLSNYLKRKKIFLYFCLIIVFSISISIYNGWLFNKWYSLEEI